MENTAAKSDHLRPIASGMELASALKALETAAMRGKLPGFALGRCRGLFFPDKAAGSGAGIEPAFHVTDFGAPFESVVEARPLGVHGSSQGVSFSLTLRLKPMLPMVTFVILLLTVWPGIWLTDSMIKTYWTGYQFPTWIWYLPLTVPSVPWVMWSSLKRSRASAREGVAEIVTRLQTVLGSPALDSPALDSSDPSTPTRAAGQ